MARIVFCEAHRLEIYGPKYTWILGGTYRDRWWTGETTLPCLRDDLVAALQGHITTDLSILSSNDEITVSGLRSSQYLKQYSTATSNLTSSKYHGYAYDGIWVVAMAIDAMLKGEPPGSAAAIDGELFRGPRFHALLNSTDFVGVTGRVTFKAGDRTGNILFKQFQDERMIDIGEVNLLMESLKFNGRLRWPGGEPPRDRSNISLQLQAVNLIIHLSVSLLAAIGIILGVFFLFINIRYREHAYIKMSSPNMNNMILIGCILAYFSVFLQGLNTRLVGEHLFSVICSLKVWVFSLGFTLSFGAMFSKTWRVHSIFTNISMNKKAIKDSKLVVMVNLLLLVDFVILVSWQVVDPPILQTRNITVVERSPIRASDTDVILYIELCASDHMTTFLIIIYLYKGFLLVVGCFLAWETRRVTMTALNDSKHIGVSVYIVVITCVSVVPVNFLVSDKPDATYLLVSLFIIFGTTVTLCLVFGPKLVEIRRDPSGKKRQMLKSIAKSTKQNCETDHIKMQITNKLQLENNRFKEILETMVRDLSKLEKIIDEHSSTLSSPTSSSINIEESVNLMRRSNASQKRQRHPDQQKQQTAEYKQQQPCIQQQMQISQHKQPQQMPQHKQKQLNSDPDSDLKQQHKQNNLGQRQTSLQQPQLSEYKHTQRYKHKQLQQSEQQTLTQQQHKQQSQSSYNQHEQQKELKEKIHEGVVVEETRMNSVRNLNEHQPFLQHHHPQCQGNQQKQYGLCSGFSKDEVPHVRRQMSEVKTPSYQGLKFIAELLDLRETDILSDYVDSEDESNLNEPTEKII